LFGISQGKGRELYCTIAAIFLLQKREKRMMAANGLVEGVSFAS